MTAILNEIIQLFTTGLTSYGQGFGAGLQAMVTGIFIDSSGQTETLSVFGGLVVVFASIALVISICSLLFHWLSSLGARN